jgi:flagellar protein FlaG
MSTAIQRSDIKVAVDMADAKPRVAVAAKPTSEVDSKPIQANPLAMVETKSKVGQELESNYKQLEAAVDEIRKMADDNLMNLGFSIDRKINTHVVVVTDKNSGEVIRQIPNEVVIRVAHNIADLKGLLFDKKM